MADATIRSGAAAIAKGSQSFAAAARLFDRPTRESAVMLYAWCRHCDDVVDGQELGRPSVREAPGTPAERLADLERKTRAVLDRASAEEDAAFEGLRRVVERHAIPGRYPLAHLDGFRMDVEGRRYGTIEHTLDYCYHVAGVVGVMMAYVMGAREPAVLDRACDLGLAFQLTNIARDIVPDAQVGRVYVPAEWLAEAGIPADEVAAPRHRDKLAGLAGRLVDTAEPYYASALAGIASLPPRAAWAIATARGVYRQIGVEVKRRGPRAWDRRVSTSTGQKLGHVARGGLIAWSRTRPDPSPRAGLWSGPA
jgi:phytoene synthase